MCDGKNREKGWTDRVLCKVSSPNGPFGKRSLHRNRAALLSRCSFLISYNLITRNDSIMDFEMLTIFFMNNVSLFDVAKSLEHLHCLFILFLYRPVG